MSIDTMNIRKKLLFSTLVIWGAFLFAIYILSHEYLLNQFLELETAQLKEDMLRVHNAISVEQTYIANMTEDWSHWDDPYNYVQGKHSKFPEENMMAEAYVSLNVDVIAFWDKSGKLLIGKMYDPTKKNEIKYPEAINNFVKTHISFAKGEQGRDISKGIISTPHGILAISASKVTDAAISKPAKGILIMGRIINKKLVERLNAATKINFDIQEVKTIFGDKIIKTHYNNLLHLKENFISVPVDGNKINAFSIIRDSNNSPIGLITTVSKRNIYILGRTTTYTLLSALGLLGLIVVWLLYKFSNRLIINRLEKLKDELTHITESKKFDGKVTSIFNDEISYVSNQINHMLNVINEAYILLERRVDERTQTLNATNKKLLCEISERKKIQNELLAHKEDLTQLAHYDSLTGLPNRVLLNAVLNKALLDTKKANKKMALLFIDLDRFKSINDAKGHETGDYVLKTIAGRLSKIMSKDEMIARIGGDEFIVIMKNIIEKNEIDILSKSILEVCAKPIKDDAQTYYLSASIGISIYPHNGKTLEELQKNADIAMYKSKTTSPGNFIYFENDMNFDATSTIELDEQIHDAIAKKQFALHYQPKYEISTWRLIGVEALIRWISPTLGCVSPSYFIPHSEKSGLIIPIGEWVLEEAFRSSVEWGKSGFVSPSISINISPVQFNRQDVIALLSNTIKKYKLDPKNFEIEITESAIIHDIDESIKKLQQIRDLGFKISIDDFGTGYTSINHIKTFPVDFLKIDKIFVDGIPNNPADMAIIESLVTLSHKLGISVVAEGIETAEQLDYLASIHCDIAQGYFLAKPMTKEDLKFELIKNQEIFGKTSHANQVR